MSVKMSKSLFVAMVFFVLAGCDRHVQQRPHDEYLAVSTPDGNVQESKGCQRSTEPYSIHSFCQLFSQLEADTIPGLLEQVYAETLYFNDTFHTIRDRSVLQQYLVDISKKVDTRVQVLDYTRSGQDVWVRWKMTTHYSLFWKDIDTTTAGMSHLHFNKAGKIDMQQDFWDSSNGFYRSVPLLGSVIDFVTNRIGPAGH